MNSFLYTQRKLGDDVEMVAMFFAQRVIYGRTDFETLPSSLKPPVYELLKESGMEYLAGDYQPPGTDE